MASTTILRAVESFTFRGPSGPVAVRKGSTYHKDSPQLQGLSAEALETNFVPFSPDFGLGGGSDIEQATAAPGEKRKGPKRTKKAPKADAEVEAKDEAPAEETPEAEQATAAPGETEAKEPETADESQAAKD